MNSNDRNRRLLRRWLEGDLAPGEKAEFLAAAAGDSELAAELEDWRRLIGRVREIDGELEPPRDLWPEIAARTRGGQRNLRWYALAAATLAALGIGVLLGRWSGTPQSEAPRLVEHSLSAASSPLARTAYAATDRELAAICDQLRRGIEASQRSLPPATRVVIFRSLQTIERAMADIESAMRERPSDPGLARTYIGYREREIDLLRRANLVASRL